MLIVDAKGLLDAGEYLENDHPQPQWQDVVQAIPENILACQARIINGF